MEGQQVGKRRNRQVDQKWSKNVKSRGEKSMNVYRDGKSDGKNKRCVQTAERYLISQVVDSPQHTLSSSFNLLQQNKRLKSCSRLRHLDSFTSAALLWCRKKRDRRGRFLAAVVRLYNQHCSQQTQIQRIIKTLTDCVILPLSRCNPCFKNKTCLGLRQLIYLYFVA